MGTEQRIAFIDQASAGNLDPFVKYAHLEPRELPKMSPEDQIKNVFLQSIFKEQPNSENRKPLYWIITDDPNKFLTAAQKVMQDAEDKKSMKDFFGSLTILKLWTKDHSTITDKATGIRIAEITEAEIKESLDTRMHPTPAH